MKVFAFVYLIFLALFSYVSAAPVIVTEVVTAPTVTITVGAENKAVADPVATAAPTEVATAAAPSSTGSSSDSGSNGSASSDTSKLGSGSGIAFSQYKDVGGCKSEDELAASIRALSKYSVIRLYDVDCDIVNLALKYKGSDQKLLVGIYNLNNIQNDVNTIISSVEKNNHWWQGIYAVTVGNEDVNFGKATADAAEAAVSAAQSALSQYNVKVSHVDVYATIDQNSALCGGDFVAANAHPYFDQSVDPSNCGSWMEDQISKLKQVCGGKDVIITETGWPTAGDSGRASKDNQDKCLASIASSSVADKVILFSGWNEKWKTSDLERSWGIMGDDPNAS